MSAPYCMVFAGVRAAIASSEVPEFETRKHPVQVRARMAKLDLWWDRVDPDSDEHFYLVGKKLAALGPEDASAAELKPAELARTVADTERKLRGADFPGEVLVQLVFVDD